MEQDRHGDDKAKWKAHWSHDVERSCHFYRSDPKGGRQYPKKVVSVEE